MELKEIYFILKLFEGSKYSNYDITNLMILKDGTINIFLKKDSHSLRVNSNDLVLNPVINYDMG